MMTPRQKRLRRYARQEGLKVKAAINRACHPVYEGDEVLHMNLAAAYARKAFQYAIASEQEAQSHATLQTDH